MSQTFDVQMTIVERALRICPTHRNARVVCADLLVAQKQPVLYWDTPAAGAVYRKLGFHAVGEWRSIWLEKSSKVEE